MIGIDFGTAFARTARVNPRTGLAEPLFNLDGELRTPTAVYFGADEVAVGSSALWLATSDTERVRVVAGVKRMLGQLTPIPLPDRNLDSAGAASEVIRRLLADAATATNEPVRRAVLTYPPDFTPVEYGALQNAIERLNLDECAMLVEPSAAVAGFEQSGGTAGDTVLLCDLGAGRFTAAPLVRSENGMFRAAVAARTRRFGGDDFDRLLYGLCNCAAQARYDRPLARGSDDLAAQLAARHCKEELSRRTSAEFIGLLTDGTLFRHSVQRAEFEDVIRAEVSGMAELARAAFDEAAARHLPIETVLLVGGAARVPLVRKVLAAAMPIKPVFWPQHELAVALGAARAAHARWGVNGPAIRVRVERTTTLAELIHRVSDSEEQEQLRMNDSNGQKRDRTRGQILDLFATKAEALDREFDRLRGVLADRIAHRDYARAQQTVCALRKIRDDDPEVAKAQAFIDSHFDKLGEVRSIAIAANVLSIALTDGEKQAWIGTGHSVGLYSLTSGLAIKSLSGHSNHVYGVTLAQGHPRVASGSHDATIRLWSTEKLKLVSSWPNGSIVRTVAFMPDGRHLASGGDDTRVRLWDTNSTAAPLNTFEGHTATVNAVNPSPDGNYLASASRDGTVRIWDVERGRQARKLTGHRGEIYCVRYFPGGRLVVSGGQDSTLRVWDAETGREMGRLEGHESPVRCVDFTPDGHYAVSGGDDRTVRVWDVASGWELRKFSGHGNVVLCIAVTHDGTQAVTGSSDNTLRIWTLGLYE
jgi:actin-like ATPase involved in cell morphogenesis